MSHNIIKKIFFSGQTEPASGRIASALCVQSSWISSAFFAIHFLSLVHLDAPLSLNSVRRTCCGPTPSSCLPLVSAPLSCHRLASCLLLAVARIRWSSLLPSHLLWPRSVRFHPLPSAASLRRFFLSLHPTVTACNMCTCSGNGTQERAVQDLLCLVDIYLVYLIWFQLCHCLWVR